MGKQPLTRESQFVVGDEKILLIIIGILFVLFFGYGVYDAAQRGFRQIDPQSFIFAAAIFPAIICFRKARANSVHIRINRKGIYEAERLVTTWDNFIKAALIQKKKGRKIYDVRDNFQMLVQYRKEGSLQILERRIDLTNTQNKSEEEVMEAVRFFWEDHQHQSGWTRPGEHIIKR